ncbi:MAG TPA: type II toxin-antitoxin system HicA family toxin [Bryobacteraceae bacterium]|nr:type II toxin-antitoxin system HicA family toxin [Bryobacteraceae bacterium]
MRLQVRPASGWQPLIWYNAATNRHTTVPNHSGDMPEGTLRAISKQAEIELETFLRV